MNKLIKMLPIIVMAASVTTGSAQSNAPSSMSDADKTKLIEELKILQDAGLSRKMKLIKAGIAAITPAAQNENDAMALYEKCYKKVNFDDNENKKDKDFREWKTSQKENLSSNYNKKALRYQAKWALITLQASMEPKETFDPSKYASQAIALMTEIYQDPKLQTEAKPPYNSPLLSGAIGQVFELQGMRPDNWPDNIMEPTRVIESLVLQPARDKGDISGLRNGWNRMIQMQKARMEMQMTADAKNSSSASNNNGRGGFGGPGGPGGRGGMRGMNLTSKGIEDMVVMMSWQREMDCYRHGDEAASALNMMTIIKGMREPKRVESYVNQLIALLEGKEDERRANRRGGEMAAGPGATRPGTTTGVATAATRPTPTTGTARTTTGNRETSGTSSSNSTGSTKTTTSGTGAATPARPATPPTPAPLPSTEGLFD